MAEALFNYPAEPPLQNSSSSPRPKTSREASRKRRRRRHHSSTEKQEKQSEKENQTHEEEEQQQEQQERPPLPSINKDKNPKSPRNMNQTDLNNKTENKGITRISSSNNYQVDDDTQFEEEEVDEILYWTENSMKDPSILEKCNPDLLPTVIINLKDLRDQYLVDNEVDESCAADRALTEARKVHKKNLMHIATKSLRQELEARLQEAEDALHDLEDTCKYQEDRMNREMAKEHSDLINKHKEETERLIAMWTSQPPPPNEEQLEIELGKTYSVRPKTSRKKTRGQNNDLETTEKLLKIVLDENTTDDRKSQKTNEAKERKSVKEDSIKDDDINDDEDQLYNKDTVKNVRKYNKLSPQLLYLYDQSDRLLKAKRYQESKAVAKKAKELEKIETQRNYIRMEQDYNAAIEALQIKQAEEIAIQEKAHNDRRNEYYHARDFDMNVAKNRIEKIKKELAAAENPDKVWALHHRHDLDIPKPDNQSPSQTQKSIYSTKGVFETSATTSTIGKEPIYSKFNRINLPPLKSGRSSRRVIKNTERSFRFNQGYVFT